MEIGSTSTKTEGPRDQNVCTLRIMEGRPHEEVQSVPFDEKEPAKVFRIGTTLGAEHEAMLIWVIKEYQDISTWEPKHMLGVDSQCPHSGGGKGEAAGVLCQPSNERGREQLSLDGEAPLCLDCGHLEAKAFYEAHLVEVVMDQPLRQILENPSWSRWIVKWVIELNEFDPRYKLQRRRAEIDLPVKDAQDHVRRSDACQRHVNIPHQPPDEMIRMLCIVPLYQWGIDIVRDLPRTLGAKRRIVGLVTYELETLEGLQVLRSWNACHLTKYHL
ncbi:hypothetical protein LIER_18500 [Lithospermum erythrorhizon]|uniref:Chromo domain-containing protein n=1 Tax=Lithospermum erythrorhizon TaxID=34254 RepID=A0AAV3QE80_LITER